MSLDTEIDERNKGGATSKKRKVYDLSKTNEKYSDDRFLLIEKINKLTNK